MLWFDKLKFCLFRCEMQSFTWQNMAFYVMKSSGLQCENISF